MRKEYMIFENMLQCYKNVDLNAKCDAECNRSFFFLARTLAEMNVRNPFSFGEKGYSEYDDMIFFFSKWNKTKKTCAFKQRFLMAAYDLCDAVEENIFDKEDPVEVVSLDEIKEQEIKRVFGVVDDPAATYKKSFDFETEYDNEVRFDEEADMDKLTNNEDIDEVTMSDEFTNTEVVDEVTNNEDIDEVTISDEVTASDEVTDKEGSGDEIVIDNKVVESNEVDSNEVRTDEVEVTTEEVVPEEKDEEEASEEIEDNESVIQTTSKKRNFIERIKNIFTKK